MAPPTQQRIVTGPSVDAAGQQHHWVMRKQWATATTYYFVAHDTITRRTTFCTKDGTPSDTTVLYFVDE